MTYNKTNLRRCAVVGDHPAFGEEYHFVRFMNAIVMKAIRSDCMKSIKRMLLGIALISFGAFAINCENTWLMYPGIIFPFLGMIICIVGFINKT